MTTLTLPFSGVPETFSTQLGSVGYRITALWRDNDAGMGGWVIDLADADSNPILQGVPLITGADLLEQFGYLGLGFKLYVQTVQDPDATPTFENLGSDANVFAILP